MALLADDCTDRALQLMALSKRLAELLDAETAAFDRRGEALPPNLADEKTRLANTYRFELTRISQNKVLITGAPEHLRKQLEAATKSLQASIKENARAVNKLKTVSEGLVKAIGDEIARKRAAPIGYGPKLGAPPAAAQGSATAITLNRMV